jgi:tRNA1(Val) A37 N6-methylase TrmN6
MALMFARIARNFIKAGYFPTDEATLARILPALDVDGTAVRILDPCCGEGTALAEVKHHLGTCGAAVQALGIEYDRERAWHAKGLLDTCIHADVNDVFVSPRAAGLLFLNPPYGNAVRDQAGTAERARTTRIETAFLRRTMGWLAFGGVLVLIVPHYAFDRELANIVARNFEAVRVFSAPEARFKQVVLFGIKRRSDAPDPQVAERLETVAQADYGSPAMPAMLPEVWSEEPYWVPRPPEGDFRFQAVSLDAAQLGAELTRLQAHTLWPQFRLILQGAGRTERRPLRDLSQWHLALALAAGQIAGVVRSRTGRTLLIKGDTFKEKELSVERHERSDGSLSETRILTDKFVPVIRGIDFTPGPQFGSIVTIR